MNFRKHFELNDKHALLSPSKYSWIRYDDEKFDQFLIAQFATIKGTKLHDLAARCIEASQKLPEAEETLCMYVNDSISLSMKPEVVLKYSEYCFGTADAIKFDEDNQELKIFDLKTGTRPAKMDQLKIYAALFCLEYNDRINFNDISIELRIYQNNEVITEKPETDEIINLMNIIVYQNDRINKRKEEGFI